VFFTDIKK